MKITNEDRGYYYMKKGNKIGTYQKLDKHLAMLLDYMKRENAKVSSKVDVVINFNKKDQLIILTLQPDYDKMFPTCFVESYSMNEIGLIYQFLRDNDFIEEIVPFDDGGSCFVCISDVITIVKELNKLNSSNSLF